MLTAMRSNTGSSELSEVGMSIPHWNIYWSSPTVLRQTDLPPALGPDISRMRFCGVRVTVSGTMLRPSRERAFSSSGWRALRRDRLPSSEMTGIPATMSSAVCALAIRKSTSPRKAAPASRSGR